MRTTCNLFLMLPCLMAILIGCGPGAVCDEVGESAVDEKDRSVEIRLKLVADWQSHFNLFYVKKSPFLNELKGMIAYEKDEERYKRYMGRFIDTAFGIQTDADESGARLQQLDSFCMITEAVMHCAESRRDWNTYWSIAFRRVERIQKDLQKIRMHFPNGDPKGEVCPVLGRGGWENCLKLLKNEYEMASRDLTKLINNFLMANVFSKAEWTVIHDRLEEILGKKIPMRQELLRIWEENQKVRRISGARARAFEQGRYAK